MSMIAAAEQYLAFRRKLGFALQIEGEQLLRFARYAERIGHKGPLTVELTLRWAKLSHCSTINHARRLDIVRRFARYLKHSVPQTEVPPEGVLGPSYRRVPPHIYSEEEVSALMGACRQLTPVNGLRPRTYATLFGLLVCTGMRISEALRLCTDDFDAAQGIITVVEGKFHKSRILPLHPSCVKALRAYAEFRERRHPATRTFFVTEVGTSLKYLKVLTTFRGIAYGLGWARDTRIHGLRHTFAVRRLLQWYRDGEDIHRRIGQLSTYLGHCKMADTYWYLSAVPELMALAAGRFEQYTEVSHG
ncbi:MAG: tyrosine-type recombinase/integrase [Candidatus Latescibacterota bacterium]